MRTPVWIGSHDRKIRISMGRGWTFDWKNISVVEGVGYSYNKSNYLGPDV